MHFASRVHFSLALSSKLHLSLTRQARTSFGLAQWSRWSSNGEHSLAEIKTNNNNKSIQTWSPVDKSLKTQLNSKKFQSCLECSKLPNYVDQHRSQLWWFGLSCCHSYWDCTFAVGGKTPTGPEDDDYDCARVGVFVKSRKHSNEHCAWEECYALPLTDMEMIITSESPSPVRTHCLWSLPKSITHWSLLLKDIYRVVFMTGPVLKSSKKWNWSHSIVKKWLSSPKIAISLLKKWNYTNATICQKFAV